MAEYIVDERDLSVFEGSDILPLLQFNFTPHVFKALYFGDAKTATQWTECGLFLCWANPALPTPSEPNSL
jgi:hypothetical protein